MKQHLSILKQIMSMVMKPLLNFNNYQKHDNNYFKKFGYATLMAVVFMSFVVPASAQISYAVSGSNYTQNFDNLYGTVPANNTTQAASLLPLGWVFAESGSGNNVLFRNDNGGTGTGDTYLDGATSSNERAFGAFASGSLTTQIGASFTNNTGSSLTQFTLSFTGEQWRDGGSATSVFNTLTFAYSVGATSLTVGTYTAVPNLNFTALVNNLTSDVALNGNLPANQSVKSFTVTGISWAPGATIFIKWSDFNDAGNDDNLAIDGVTFTASSGVLTATQLAVVSVNGGASPSATDPFTVVVQSQNSGNAANNVVSNTNVSLSLATGVGVLGGTLTGTILAGTSSVTFTGITYDISESDVSITATQISGDVLTPGTSALFTVFGAPIQLGFVNVPTAGSVNIPISSFTVEARRADFSVDPNYNGSITLTLNSGPGTLSGTLTAVCASGIAFFNNVMLSATGNYTLLAQASGLSNDTSTSINILSPVLTEVLIPQYMQGNQPTNNNRTPYAYLATLSGLNANSTYKYINQVIVATDGPTAGGAGNVLYADAGAFYYTSTTGFTNPAQHGQFLTDASGSYTGWFISIASGNVRFAQGNNVFMRIRLNDGAGGTSTVSYLTTTSPTQVVNFGNLITNGTALRGNSNASPKNFVVAYDNETGTGRPIGASMVEFDGNDLNTAGSIAAFYLSSVELTAGAYGMVIPNNLSNGIRRMEQRDLIGGAIVGCPNTDANGVWPSSVNTVNPTSGGTALVLTITDAPLSTTTIITASAGANGSISPNGATSVTCGANQTFTITPNSGYLTVDVIVDGVSQGSILTYTFTNVLTTHTISATFCELSVAPTSISTDDALNDFEICFGDSIHLTQVGGSLGAGATYNWYSNTCGGTFLGTGNTIGILPSVTTSYFVRAEGACNTTACATILITVKTSGPSGTVQAIIVPASACAGNPISGSTALIGNTTYYVWSGPGGTTFNGVASPAHITSNNPTIVLGTPLSSGWSICVQGENACGVTSNTKCSFIRGTVSQPGTISGSAIACINTIGNYSINSVSGADVYDWTVTGDASVTGTGTTATVNFGNSFIGGNLCVRAKLNCGTVSTYRCILISNATTLPGLMNGSSVACPGSTITYSVSSVSGASSYNWSASCAGASIVNNGASADVTFPASFASCLVCVTANSACGVPSAARCKTVTNGTPGVPSAIIGLENGVCGSVQNYMCSSVSGATGYVWSVGGGIGTVNGSGTSVSVNWNGTGTAGTLSVVATNSCGASGMRTINIRLIPGANTGITGDALVCSSNPLANYAVGNAAGAAGYNWSVLPAGATVIPSGATAIIDFSSQLNGSYTVYATSFNACGNGNTKTFAVVLSSCARVIKNNYTNTEFNLTAYPNPALNNVNIKYNSNAESNYNLNIVDVSGRTIYVEQGKTVSGVNLIKVDISSFARGIYLVKLNSGNDNSFVRLVVE